MRTEQWWAYRPTRLDRVWSAATVLAWCGWSGVMFALGLWYGYVAGAADAFAACR